MRSQNPKPTERRGDARRLCSELVAVSWRDQTGRELVEHAILEDMSRHGVSFNSTYPISCGRPVQLSATGFLAEGHVVHCEPCEYGYIVGLRFSDGLEWDPERWTPAHMLTLPAPNEN